MKQRAPAKDPYLQFLEDLGQLDASDQTPDDEVRAGMETYLKIRPRGGQRLVPLRFNVPQERMWQRRSDRLYVLKSRQLGATTLFMAEAFMRCCLRQNEYWLILSHRAENATRIFQMALLYYRNLPEHFRRRINAGKSTAAVANKKELFFSGTNSRMVVDTAGAPDAARGLTLTGIIGDELAAWPADSAEDTMSAMLAALVPGAPVRILTTPKLAGSYAYTVWQRAVSGESSFAPCFLCWWDDPQNSDREETPAEEWTDEERELALRWELDGRQIHWRRRTMADQRDLFRCEYPEDQEECWLASGETVFNLRRVLGCWDKSFPDPVKSAGKYGPGERWHIPREECRRMLSEGSRFVIGADPAEGTADGDFSAVQVIDRRTGAQVYSAHLRVPLFQFASLLNDLGRNLGNAAIAVERNNHGHAVLQRLLLDIRYPNLLWGDDGKVGLGITAREKALLIGDLDRTFWEGSIVLRDVPTFEHIRTFVYDERRRPGAIPGAHDDLVSALLCAWRAALTARGGAARYVEIAYPKEKRAAEEIMDEAAESASAWMRTYTGGVIPFTPETAFPEAQGSPHDKIWRCDRCGGGDVAIRGWDQDTWKPRLSCARCGQPAPETALARR